MDFEQQIAKWPANFRFSNNIARFLHKFVCIELIIVAFVPTLNRFFFEFMNGIDSCKKAIFNWTFLNHCYFVFGKYEPEYLHISIVGDQHWLGNCSWIVWKLCYLYLFFIEIETKSICQDINITKAIRMGEFVFRIGKCFELSIIFILFSVSIANAATPQEKCIAVIFTVYLKKFLGQNSGLTFKCEIRFVDIVRINANG